MGIREAILHDVKEQGIEIGMEKGLNEKERIFVTRGWKKGLAPVEIADLADMPIEKVEAIIQELAQGGSTHE